MEKPRAFEAGQLWKFRGRAEPYTIAGWQLSERGWTPAGCYLPWTIEEMSRSHAWEFLGGPAPEPPKDEERCPCGMAWKAASEIQRKHWTCTHGADEPLSPLVCANRPVVVCEGDYWDARCAEHAPKAFRAAPACERCGGIHESMASQLLCLQEAIAKNERAASRPRLMVPRETPKPSPDTCTVSACSLGEKCVTCNPKKPEPFYPAVDDFDLLPDA